MVHLHRAAVCAPPPLQQVADAASSRRHNRPNVYHYEFTATNCRNFEFEFVDLHHGLPHEITG